ncbi:hypothetical protein ACLOJK_033899 [Asimina triloba]
MATVSLKRNYRCVPSLQEFYTGGPFAVSSDGSFLACACGDTIKIVDSSNASVTSSIKADTESITAIALSPDDKLLFSSSHSRLIRVWELSSLKCLRSWKGHEGPVMAMACDSSGGLLATAGADRKVLVWDVDGGFCTHYFKGHKGIVISIIFNPDPNRLLALPAYDDSHPLRHLLMHKNLMKLFSGSDDATVRVWDLENKKCCAVLEKHFSAVTSLALSEDGWTLLSAGVKNPIIEVSSTLEQHNKLGGKEKKSSSSTVYFLTAGERGVVRIWNSEGTGEHSAVCIYEQQSSDATVSSDEDDVRRGFTSAVTLPLDQGLLCVTADQQFLFYSPTESVERSFQLSLTKRLVGHNEEIVDLKFLGEEEQFLAVATNLEQVRVYDLASMSCSYVLAGHTDIVLCLDTCISASGNALIVTGSKDNTKTYLDFVSKGKHISETSHDQVLRSLCLVQNIANATSIKCTEFVVRVWEHKRQCSVGVGTGHMGAVGAVAFSKKQKNFFVSGSSDHTLKVWSLDGLSENDNEVINLKAKAVVAAHDKDINSVAVAPNDSFVCSGSQDRTACVWRLPDLVSVVVLRGHKRGIWSVEFSPVDQCADGLVKLWTVKTNECIATYDQHDAKIWAVAVGKKTEMLATGGGDAVVNLWYDCTAADKEEVFRKEEEGILKGQELENAVVDSDYARAIQLAFELRRPHKLFDLFAELCRKRQIDNQIKEVLLVLGKDETRLLLEYVREWNTKPKLAHVAQFVLFQVFNILPPTEIIEIKGITELLEGLIPYSQRHFSRIDRLLRSTFLLDYTLTGMSVIDPEADMIAPQDENMVQTDDKQAKNMPTSAEINGKDQNQGSAGGVEEKVVPSKKRKSSKSRSGAKKYKSSDSSAVEL